ncbi:hypothetical protein BDZ89DRAFT_1081048 [Hymenopellis radicata]|nr:hypothetical protein BDZ89DRAFT_1081048 [Hymenopellis radicata]
MGVIILSCSWRRHLVPVLVWSYPHAAGRLQQLLVLGYGSCGAWSRSVGRSRHAESWKSSCSVVVVVVLSRPGGWPSR